MACAAQPLKASSVALGLCLGLPGGTEWLPSLLPKQGAEPFELGVLHLPAFGTAAVTEWYSLHRPLMGPRITTKRGVWLVWYGSHRAVVIHRSKLKKGGERREVELAWETELVPINRGGGSFARTISAVEFYLSRSTCDSEMSGIYPAIR
jgi:hypothetical protein